MCIPEEGATIFLCLDAGVAAELAGLGQVGSVDACEERWSKASEKGPVAFMIPWRVPLT